MPTRLVEIFDRIGAQHKGTKPQAFYARYDQYFAELADRPIALLELGVLAGDSTKMFASFFVNGKVIGVDIEDRGIDFSLYPNIVFAQGDQRSAEQLGSICATHAPHGLDIVIDDASHYGWWSAQSYAILYPHLKPGGLYVVEDWATGYWDDWPDGGRFQRFIPETADDQIPKRVPSHDFGMVGFIKSLVDEVVPMRSSPKEPFTRERRLEFVHAYPEFVVAKKFAV